jgi:hypothetical protein
LIEGNSSKKEVGIATESYYGNYWVEYLVNRICDKVINEDENSKQSAGLRVRTSRVLSSRGTGRKKWITTKLTKNCWLLQTKGQWKPGHGTSGPHELFYSRVLKDRASAWAVIWTMVGL